ncbi:MAG: ABC transporter permease [Planctomycetaceae bacterium]|nr:ABC transporter permease [Planctomycetaceae bacterium]
MKKAWIVARHEFLVTVKRVWFVVATFVLPFLFAGIGYGMHSVGQRAVEESIATVRNKPLGYVDQWGGLGDRPGFLKYPGETQAKEALLAKAIGSYLIVPEDYLQRGEIQVMTLRRPTLMTAQQPPLPPGVREWLLDAVLKDVTAERLRRAKSPFEPRMVFLDESGAPSQEDVHETEKRALSAYAFFMLLFMSIFTSSAYLLQGMAEEKENRVMEMVLSSITPDQLMLGKLIGLGSAGLLQMAVWSTMSIVTLVLLAMDLAVAPVSFALCFVYFLLGYVLFGSLMLGFGALGTNLRESQQMASIWSFLGASPAMIVIALFEAPQGTVARVFSYIPFTAPTTMMFRYVIDPKGTPIYDIAGSMLLLVASTWFALRISARLYRAGLLLYGKRPGVKEIWRWMLQSRT